MRILVTSTPGTGHIHPMMPLVRELADRGHDVLWATGATSCATVESFGIRATPAGLDLADRNRRFLPHLAELVDVAPRDRRPHVMPILMGHISTPPMADDLRPLFDRFRPDLVVHEVAELAAAALAGARDIPRVTVGFSDVVAPDVIEGVAAAVAPLWLAEGLSPRADAGWFEHLYLHPFPPSLTASVSLGEPADRRDRMFEMRPVPVGSDAAYEPPDWLESFGSERPGVYVTFGTEVGVGAPWSPILEALSSFDVDVVVTLGRADVATGVAASIGSVPPNVRLETWVPQQLLLERASMVISHAGAGTMLAAGAAGVAQLCVPIGADQWQNADAVARAGAGLVAEMSERTTELLSTRVAELLAGTCQAGAARVAAEIAAMPAPPALAPQVEALTRL